MPNPSIREQVELIRGGKTYFDALLALIAKAEKSIHFQTYIFDEDETGAQVADALKAASLRRVEVFLLVDGYASGGLSRGFIQSLTEAGIRFKMYNPLLKSKYFYLGRRLHHKVVTVDARYCLVGGINISDRYNDLPGQPAWFDCAVYAEGRNAEVLTKICEHRMEPRWKVRLIGTRSSNLFKHQAGPVRVNVNDWVRARRDITRSYIDMFQKANGRIIILSAYFLPNDQFRKRMRAAVQRGVKVEVILAGTSDSRVAKNAERYMYRWLVRNGIEIFEYQKSVLHGKMAAYDGEWATVGSYNVNTISAFASIELNLGVTDRKFVQQVEQVLQDVMEKDCLRITPETLAASGFWTQVAQRSSYYLYRILFFLFTFYFKQHE
jgi:cardiolipin synthase